MIFAKSYGQVQSVAGALMIVWNMRTGYLHSLGQHRQLHGAGNKLGFWLLNSLVWVTTNMSVKPLLFWVPHRASLLSSTVAAYRRLFIYKEKSCIWTQGSGSCNTKLSDPPFWGPLVRTVHLDENTWWSNHLLQEPGNRRQRKQWRPCGSLWEHDSRWLKDLPQDFSSQDSTSSQHCYPGLNLLCISLGKISRLIIAVHTVAVLWVCKVMFFLEMHIGLIQNV